MADNVDPLKNTLEGFHLPAAQSAANTDGRPRRPSYSSVWTRQPSTDTNQQLYFPSEQQSQPQSQSASNKKFRLFKSLNRSLSRYSDSFDYGIQNSYSSSNAGNQLPQSLSLSSEQAQIHNIEQGQKSNSQSRNETWNTNLSESYHGESYGQEEEYYNHEKPYKKKGLSSKIDRLVRRIPALGKVYKQPPNSPDRSESTLQFQYDQSSISADSRQFERELTADELALNQRYTDKTRMKLINLQVKDQTQPVDIHIHHETNKIYSCDVGRSVVEIYDINGTLLHVIDDSTMLKFQPTAIAIAFDETIIIASHFNHRLHMYSPNDSQNASNSYSYKQFKLGTPGDQIHQFYHPAGIAIDHKDGFLYVCDRGNYRIQVIRPEGICERVIELFVKDKKKIPLDVTRVAIQANLDQLVCIVGNGDALCFIPKLANGRLYVDPFYILDENGLGLEGASGLAVDTHDRIFISDTAHQRIVICTPEGGYITSFGREGDGLGELKRPCGLDITSDGILVVTDPGNKRLQLFGLTQEQTVADNNPSSVNQEDTGLDLFANL